MVKKLLIYTALAAFLVAGIGAWLLLGSSAHFRASQKYFYIPTQVPNKQQLLHQLQADSIISHPMVFSLVANRLHYFDHIKPGKYKISKKLGLLQLVRMLDKGRQEEVRLVIGKIRTPQELAQKISRNIEQDSTAVMQFISHQDSLAMLGVNTTNWMTLILPNTYNIYWTQRTSTVLKKLKTETDAWWRKNDRLEKAAKLGFSATDIYIIASIVEEETNMATDKPLVASVYINRLRKGMPLQADPTVRFAMQNFALNRITFAHLRTPSAFNTYLHKGLPPGPICIPSLATIDAVLQSPDTDYLFFVAKSDFSGYSIFSSNFKDHSRAAKLYQDSLTAWQLRKAARQQNEAN